MARYVTAVANNGKVYNLTLIDKVTDTNGNLQFDNSAELRNEIELDDEVWDAIHAGMRQVVQKKAYFSTVAVDVAGKTGTAQKYPREAGKNLVSFIGFVEAEDRTVVIYVVVDEAHDPEKMSKSATASTMASAILEEALPYLKIYPEGEIKYRVEMIQEEDLLINEEDNPDYLPENNEDTTDIIPE